MWSHSDSNRRRVLGLAACLLAAPLLSACSFQPLYGTTPSGQSVKQAMADVAIGTVPGRVGLRIRNDLVFTATGGGGESAARPRYRLEIAIREWENAILVEQTGKARGVQYNLEANFKLVRADTNKIVLNGRTSARAAYDKFDPIYSNIRARIDAENRAAREVSEGIRTRVAAFLSRPA